MKANTRFCAVALAGVVALLVPVNAHAVCASPVTFGQFAHYVVTSPNEQASSIRSNFWILNSGNPAFGSGTDNGNQADSVGWMIPYGTGQFVSGDWAGNAGYDGCADPTIPVASQRMVMSFSDVDGTNQTRFAVACVQRVATAANQFDFDTVRGGSDITLVSAPKAVITNTLRAGNEATITVGAPNFAANYYVDVAGDSLCAIANVIPQYDVYSQQPLRNISPSTSRDSTTGWVLVGTGNAGAPFTFTTTCGTTNCDVYVAVAPHFNGNFTTGEAATGQPARVGLNSNKIQAGPVLAETPKFKVIKNVPRGGPKSNQQ